MAVAKKKVSAQAVGRAFAKLAQHEPVIHEVWVSDHGCGHGCDLHIWIVVDPIDMDTQRELYRLISPLYDQFDNFDAQLHVLNPNHYRGDVHQAIPTFAEQIPFRAD